MQLLGRTDDAMVIRPPIYLKAYDPEFNNGRGRIQGTEDYREAIVFPSKVEAYACLKQSPKCHPTRASDGRPNRPLTAYHVCVTDLDADGKPEPL